MKQIKVSETTPIQLDWLVAKCEGKYYGDIGHQQVYVHNPDGTLYCAKEHWTPSTNWAQGGPILDMEGISVWETCDAVDSQRWSAITDIKTWGVDGYSERRESFGPTPLIAVCRCYVASKLGDVVEVPEELE